MTADGSVTRASHTAQARNGSSEPTLATRLAEKICAFRLVDMTARALSEARTAIIDTIGCTLAGIPEPCAQILLETPGVADAPGPALVFGTSHRTSALDATLINGTASHALDYDDVSGVLGGHHSAPVTAPIFALGEQLKVSGRRALAAYVIGVETEVRLSRAVNFHHYDKGWHPTATLGTFGAAAAASHLLGLDVARTAKALALAASFSCGIKANFGTMTKPLHVGHVGRNGLFAALIAERGFEFEPRRARAQAGLARGLQWPGQLLARADVRGLGLSLGDRVGRERSQAVSLLRLDASGHCHDAGAGARGRRYGRWREGHRNPRASAPLAAHQQPRSTDAARRQVLDPIRDGSCAR